jgi:hypothetical protein
MKNYIINLPARLGIFLLLALILAGCRSGGSAKTGTSNPSDGLLPAPQKIELKMGVSINPKKIKTIYLYRGAGGDARFAANLLKEEINRLYGHLVKLEDILSYEELSGPAIVLGIPSEDQGFSGFCSGLPSPQKDNAEAYVLDIKKGLVTVSGSGKAGLFYGVQTLVQLMEDAKWGNEPLQGMLIQDWPDLELRWVHYNYFFHLDRYEYIKESIQKLARYKVNGIVFEFEDRFGYQSHPFVAAPNSLSPEQVKELTLFARNYHIDIVPLVQGFGHAAYLLKHEEIKHLREHPEVYQSFCPLKDETYEFIFDLFRETIEATPDVKYFHIGADEVRVMGKCPLCKEKVKKDGELGLHLTWLNKVNSFMEDHGRTIVSWDDMPLKQAGIYKLTNQEASEDFDSTWAGGIARLDRIIDQFPQDGIFMRWNYGIARDKGNVKTLDWYGEKGFRSMVGTAVIGNWPLIPKYDWTPVNIKSFVTLGAEKGAMGALCTAWGDDGGNHFEIYWLGFLATAEYAWSSKSPATLEEYWEKYIRRFFGPHTEGLVTAFHNLSERVEFWNTALMEEGEKHRRGYGHISISDPQGLDLPEIFGHAPYQLISLPDIQNTPQEGSWTAHFQPLMDSARVEKAKCVEALEILERNMGKVTDNAYNLEVFASMGRFMEAHCDFVLSIGEMAGYCDQSANALKENQKQKVDANLNKMAAVAGPAWDKYMAGYEDLKEVWEVARLTKGEEGYMMDPQTKYMAGWTADLSYLIYAEKTLDFPGYAERLRKMAGRYLEDGTLSDKD